MAVQLTPELDAMLLELRNTYIGNIQPQQQTQDAQQFLSQPMQQQQLTPQPMIQGQTPQLPAAAPLMPQMQPSMTASLSGLRPNFQVPNQATGIEQQAQSNAGSPLLAQRLQQFMNPSTMGMNASPNPAMEQEGPQENKPSGFLSGLGNLASGIASNPQAASGLISGAGTLAKGALPYLAGTASTVGVLPLALGVAGAAYGGKKLYDYANS